MDDTRGGILLVEDNPSDRELALYALKRGGQAVHVETVRDGVEALEYVLGDAAHDNPAAHAMPRVILLDLKMPRIDGLEVLRRLKSDPRTRVIPVVMLTSSQEERDIAASYALGANSYVVKPVDLAQFNEALAAVGRYWGHISQPSPVAPANTSVPNNPPVL